MAKSLSILAEKILSFCRSRDFREGHVLALRGAFLHAFYRRLNPIEQNELQTALNELADVKALRSEGADFALTKAGVKLLYPSSV